MSDITFTYPHEPGQGYNTFPNEPSQTADIITPSTDADNPPGITPEYSSPQTHPNATKRTTKSQRELEWNLSASGQFIKVVLGSRRVGFDCIYAKADQTWVTLWMMGGLCEGPVSAIQPYMNDVPLAQTGSSTSWKLFTATNASCWVYDGTQVNTADNGGLQFLKEFDAQHLVTGEVVQDQPFTNLALTIIKLTYNATAMASIPSFTYDVDGVLCYDPRSGLVKWTDNPALLIREVLTNKTWGLGNFDDRDEAADPNHKSAINDAAFAYAADRCDLDIGNGVRRYRLNFAMSTQATAADWLDTLCSHCMGILSFVNGKYALTIDEQFIGTKPKFSVSNWVEGSTVKLANVIPDTVKATRRERSSMFNAVRVWYSDSGDYPTAAPTYSSSTTYSVSSVVAYAGDKYRSLKAANLGHTPNVNPTWWYKLSPGNRWQSGSVLVQTDAAKNGTELQRLGDFRLDGCPTKDMATRIATTKLNRSLDEYTISFRADRTALSLIPGDVFDFNGAGLAWQPFRTKTVSSVGDLFEVRAEEYHDGSYNDTVNNEDLPVNESLPDPTAIPPDPTGVSAAPQYIVGPDGRVTLKIMLNWTPGETPFYATTRITVNDGLTTRTLGEFAQGPAYIENPREGAQHLVVFYTITTWGVSSPGFPFTILPVIPGDIDPVNNLTLPCATLAERGRCWWTDPDYAYIDHFEIFDMFGNPDSPPLIMSVPYGSSPSEDSPLDLSTWIHGDGYLTDETLSIMVVVVATNTGRSEGRLASWTLPPSGQTEYNVKFDPRMAAFDGANIWVTNFGSNKVSKLNRSSPVPTDYATGSNPYGLFTDGLTGTIPEWKNTKVYKFGDYVTHTNAGTYYGRFISLADSNTNHSPSGDASHVWWSPESVWIANVGGSPHVMRLRVLDGVQLGSYSNNASFATPVCVAAARFQDTSGANRFDVWTTNYTASRLVRTNGATFGTFSPTGNPIPTTNITVTGSKGGPMLIVNDDQGHPWLWSSWQSGQVFGVNLSRPLGSLIVDKTFSLPRGHSGPWGLCYDGANIWVACYSTGTLVAFNPSTLAVVGTVGLGSRPPGVPGASTTTAVDVKYDGESLWVADGGGRQLIRVSPSAMAVVGRVPLGSYPRLMVYDGTDLWVPANANGVTSTVSLVVRNPPGTQGGGGDSNSFDINILGTTPSPLPS